MNIHIKHISIFFLALAASLFLLEAHAGKPVKVTVTAADPPSAVQGEITEVDIDGTGFDAGSTARFIVTDTRDDTQIDVNEVIFDAVTGKLKAKIKVKNAALPVEYDIEVMNSSGRRGKGTTLFRVREKVGESDPCLTSTSPFPAFMFWRNLGNPTQGEYAIFLASEDGVCIRPLVDVPDSRNAWTWKSSFGYDQANEHGYVAWAKGGWGDDESEIWLQEFTVDGNTIDPPPDPELIVIIDLSNTDGLVTVTRDLDISADLQNLAFALEQGAQPEETHVIEIASCRSPYPPCIPSEDTLVLKESEGSFPNDSCCSWGNIAWGPLDKRLYLQIFRGDPLGVNQWGIQMITLTEGSWTGEKVIEDRELFTDDDYPEYEGVLRMGSFISADGEKLAFRHSGECRTISVIDVANCEAGPTESNPRPCEAEAQFFGTNPSWTDRGTIIHEIVEKVKKHPRKEIYNCISSDFIGEWDPVNSEVTTLAEGEDPDAG